MTKWRILSMVKLEDLKNSIRKFDPSKEEGSHGWYAMLLLLTAAHVGANFKRCCRFMKIRPYTDAYDIVHDCRSNLIRNGMWKNGKLHISNWNDKNIVLVGSSNEK
jgi:hypothetical protein